MTRVLHNLTVVTLALSVTLLTSCARSDHLEPSQSNHLQKNDDSQIRPSQPCLNINTASAAELVKLPGVGEVTARRIVEYRERNGEFRRKEEIIIIDGFSEKKYREIEDKICVE